MKRKYYIGIVVSFLACGSCLSASAQLIKSPVKKTKEEEPVAKPVNKPVIKKNPVVHVPVETPVVISRETVVEYINKLLQKSKSFKIAVQNETNYSYVLEDIQLSYNTANDTYRLVFRRAFNPSATAVGWTPGYREVTQTDFNFRDMMQVLDTDEAEAYSPVKSCKLMLSKAASYNHTDKFSSSSLSSESVNYTTTSIKIYYSAVEPQDRAKLANAFMRLKEIDKRM
jgi:hypothetical protein